MKLTNRGNDILRATVAGSIIATVLDLRIVLVLCLSVVFIVLISEIILARSFTGNLRVEPEVPSVSCYKGEEAWCNLAIRNLKLRFVNVSVSKLVPPAGVETEIQESDKNLFRMRFKPNFSGRFSGVMAEFELNDPLQIFSKKIEFATRDFHVDCYPSSILKEVRSSVPLAVSLGEVQGVTHGAGSEFYAIDEYRGVTERKNIFWRRVASMPDERLLVKMRVANIQKSISIALLLSSERAQDRIKWIDSACEGVGAIGKAALQIGCEVEIKFDDGKEIISQCATDLRELSNAIMLMSTSHTSNLDNASLLLSESDICVTGYKELENELLASAVARKPALLIEDAGVSPSRLSELSMIYGPSQNLGSLVNRVVGI